MFRFLRLPTRYPMILAGLFLLAGCAQIGTLTSTPTQTLTETPISTRTLIPPTFTRTLAPLPTLSDEAAFTRLEELLQDNSGCELPCWWGFTPGTSTAREFQESLYRFTGITTYFKFSDVMSDGTLQSLLFHIPGDEIGIEVSFSFISTVDGNNIRLIEISMATYREVEGGFLLAYDDVWSTPLYKNYTLSAFLTTYGLPDQISLSIQPGNPDALTSDYFYVWLLYPRRGIFARYTTGGHVGGTSMIGCPSNSFVELWLLPPSDDDAYVKVLSSMIGPWDEYFRYYRFGNFPIYEVEDLSANDFYEEFRQPTDRCLEMSISDWPLIRHLVP